MAVSALQGGARVETDIRGTGHQGVVGEAVVLAGVGYFQNIVAEDRVGTEGLLAAGFGDVDAVPRFEPLARSVHQGYQGNGGVAQLGREGGEIVKGLFGGRIENVEALQGRQSLALIEGEGCGFETIASHGIPLELLASCHQ